MKQKTLMKTVAATLSAALLATSMGTTACSSLAIMDAKGDLYHGRTMELEFDLPSWMTYYPKGTFFQKIGPSGEKSVSYTSKYDVLAITTDVYNDGNSHNVVQGLNSGGLSFSLNMVQSIQIDKLPESEYAKSIPITAIGEWALSNFATVAEVKEAVENNLFWLPRIPLFDNVEAPAHFAFYDKQGGSIVVEAANGKFVVYDNPTRVLTNSPDFPWHLTNLNNYTQLNNLDQSVSRLGNMDVMQPDSGIATSALPSSDTAVGRFIRGVYYVTYAKKAENSVEAMNTLSHIMNRFDRTKDITMDKLSESGVTSELSTEYTVWTALEDVARGVMQVRGYNDVNYTTYTLEQFKDKKEPVFVKINVDLNP